MNRPLNITVVMDGKPGHENQSLGLAEALARRVPVEIERSRIRAKGFLPPLVDQKPDLVIGAGHRSHLPLLLLARRTRAVSAVLMKPSLPVPLFDICLMPEHDLKGTTPPANVVATTGALNRVHLKDEQEKRSGLILIGGPSAHHKWDSEAVRSAVRTIVNSHAELPWRMTDSRRTPEGELDALHHACPAVAPYAHTSTGPEWLPQRLADAQEVWVSEDSVSMIYESLSSGASVGLLPTPRKSQDNRVILGIESLIRNHWVTRFEDWIPGEPLNPPPSVLKEADRCANIILKRFFPDYTK